MGAGVGCYCWVSVVADGGACGAGGCWWYQPTLVADAGCCCARACMQPPLRRLRAGAVLCHAAALFCAGTETCRNDVYCPSSCTVLQAVVDTISKYLPGNRAGMNAASFALLKVQTGGGAGAWVSGLFGGCLASSAGGCPAACMAAPMRRGGASCCCHPAPLPMLLSSLSITT